MEGSHQFTDRISQFSISADGSRVAFSSINEGFLDIFLLKNPLNNGRATSLKQITGRKEEFWRRLSSASQLFVMQINSMARTIEWSRA